MWNKINERIGDQWVFSNNNTSFDEFDLIIMKLGQWFVFKVVDWIQLWVWCLSLLSEVREINIFFLLP